jgi:hypothetical protein
MRLSLAVSVHLIEGSLDLRKDHGICSSSNGSSRTAHRRMKYIVVGHSQAPIVMRDLRMRTVFELSGRGRVHKKLVRSTS